MVKETFIQTREGDTTTLTLTGELTAAEYKCRITIGLTSVSRCCVCGLVRPGTLNHHLTFLKGRDGTWEPVGNLLELPKGYYQQGMDAYNKLAPKVDWDKVCRSSKE